MSNGIIAHVDVSEEGAVVELQTQLKKGWYSIEKLMDIVSAAKKEIAARENKKLIANKENKHG